MPKSIKVRIITKFVQLDAKNENLLAVLLADVLRVEDDERDDVLKNFERVRLQFVGPVCGFDCSGSSEMVAYRHMPDPLSEITERLLLLKEDSVVDVQVEALGEGDSRRSRRLVGIGPLPAECRPDESMEA